MSKSVMKQTETLYVLVRTAEAAMTAMNWGDLD